MTHKRPATSKKTTSRKRRPRNLIDDVAAILLISPNAKKLCEFYKATLGLPLKEEVHDGTPLHYGYSLGDVHFAIHPAKDWPGVPTKNARSPVINFSSSNVKAVAKRLVRQGREGDGTDRPWLCTSYLVPRSRWECSFHPRVRAGIVVRAGGRRSILIAQHLFNLIRRDPRAVFLTYDFADFLSRFAVTRIVEQHSQLARRGLCVVSRTRQGARTA